MLSIIRIEKLHWILIFKIIIFIWILTNEIAFAKETAEAATKGQSQSIGKGREWIRKNRARHGGECR